MTLASATLFAINPKLNFILIVIFGGVSFLLTFTLPNDSKNMKRKEIDIVLSYFAHIKTSISNMVNDRYLMMIIIFTAINMRLYPSLIIFSYMIFSKTTNLLIVLVGIFIQQICFGSWNLIIQSRVLDKAPTSDVKSTMASIK